jgi:adenylate cyclase
VDIRQVGRDLGVRYVLEGSVRKAGTRVRITGQLIGAASGRHIWADKFDGSLEDIFELQDQITESVVGAIEPSLRLAEIERARVKPTDSLDAYDLYLRALPHHASMTRAGLREALNLLHQAIELDPGYTVAKAYAAFTITTIKGQGWATDSDIREGAQLAREALAESRDDPTVLALAGMAVGYLDRDFDAGVAALDRAMSLNPMSALVVSRNAYVRTYNGDVQTAIEHFHRAIRLSPLDPDMGLWLNSLGFCYVALGEFEQAIAFSERSTRETPALVGTWRMLAITMAHAGRLPEAQAALRRMLELSPGFTIRQARSSMFFCDPCHAELYLEGLRLAGLSE